LRGELKAYDTVVVGSGPNGLAAAITLAEAGRTVAVLEADETPGGGLRTKELLESGFRHDVCATVMALAPLTPFLSGLGLDLVIPPAPLAHPFDDGTAAVAERSIHSGYRDLVRPFVRHARELLQMIMGPPRLPRHPLLLERFAWRAFLPATTVVRRLLKDRDARTLFAGAAAHSLLSLDEPGSSAFGLLMLASAHAGGWPIARGGSASVAQAMIRRLEELGGRVECGVAVTSVEQLPPHKAALLDVAVPDVLSIAGSRLPDSYRSKLQRFRPGPGIFKLDWTLDAPIPWRAPDCSRAGTVHLGGTWEEIAASEGEVARGRHPVRPFVLLTQPTLFDNSRAPAGKHVAWAYCHVPNGSDRDMSDAIEAQVERFAPGFRDVVRARKAWSPAALQRLNRNLVGGDIMGGRNDIRQLLFRPVVSLNPYATPDPSLFICSAATPPGGGVHGMCGVNAARAALKTRLR
jgi:phytoene dehydrogenase-like protein